MAEQSDLHKARIVLANQKRKLERLDREVVEQRKKIAEQRAVVRNLEKKNK